ncbi:MAG: hypothetical protein JWP08_2595 [Bryobacterales bacterium]|nr:hypothetical protein [Bryobacterales bacterium]
MLPSSLWLVLPIWSGVSCETLEIVRSYEALTKAMISL